MNTHSAEEIVDTLPKEFISGDREIYVKAVQNAKPIFGVDGKFSETDTQTPLAVLKSFNERIIQLGMLVFILGGWQLDVTVGFIDVRLLLSCSLPPTSSTRFRALARSRAVVEGGACGYARLLRHVLQRHAGRARSEPGRAFANARTLGAKRSDLLRHAYFPAAASWILIVAAHVRRLRGGRRHHRRISGRLRWPRLPDRAARRATSMRSACSRASSSSRCSFLSSIELWMFWRERLIKWRQNAAKRAA